MACYLALKIFREGKLDDFKIKKLSWTFIYKTNQQQISTITVSGLSSDGGTTIISKYCTFSRSTPKSSVL